MSDELTATTAEVASLAESLGEITKDLKDHVMDIHPLKLRAFQGAWTGQAYMAARRMHVRNYEQLAHACEHLMWISQCASFAESHYEKTDVELARIFGDD